MALVTSVVEDHVATITIDNPGQRNALTHDLLDELTEAFSAAGTETRVAILRAEPGVTIWSSGHDISELPSDGSDPLTWTNPLEACFRAMRQTPFPVIAAVEGSVWGGATELVLSCDLVVADETATFAMTPAKLGIPYNTEGVARFVESLPLNLVREMFFLAEPVSAATFHQYGVINRLVPDGTALTAAATALAARIASLSPLAIAAIKAEITTLTDARSVNSEQFERLAGLRQAAWRSLDYKAALEAFRDRQTPVFRGH